MAATIASSIQSSYAGGALLTISGSNFYDGSIKDINYIEVCGNGT